MFPTFKKFSLHDQTQLDVPEFHRTMPAHCPPPYITTPERIAYLEKRDKALTDLEAWLESHKFDYVKAAQIGKTPEIRKEFYVRADDFRNVIEKIKEL